QGKIPELEAVVFKPRSNNQLVSLNVACDFRTHRLSLCSHLNTGKIFKKSDNSGMIEAATAFGTHGRKELFNDGSGRNGDADGSSRILYQAEIFRMQVDFKARREISIEDLFRFLIETFAAGQASGQSANHFLGINSGFCAKYESFADGGEINRDND